MDYGLIVTMKQIVDHVLTKEVGFQVLLVDGALSTELAMLLDRCLEIHAAATKT